MSVKRRDILTVIITCAFVLAVLAGLTWFNGNIIPRFSGVVRLVLATVAWWPMLLATIFFMRRDKETAKDIGFSKEKVPHQILAGVLVAIGSLAIFVVLPALLGFKMGFVGSLDAFRFINMIFAVALVEEIIFRGHLFKKLFDITESKWSAILISSALFGLFHIFNWSILQIIGTTIIGIYWCICREKMRHCTLLALIIGHALHNTIHPVITTLFFG